MKGLSLLNKIIYGFNLIFALLLLAACAVPHISVEYLAFLSFLSLAVPLLVFLNLLFFIYWAVQRKRQLLISLFPLVFGYFTLGTFVKFSFGKVEFQKEDLKLMSYNVRGFNRYGALPSTTVFEDIKSLVDQEQPDIICFQEVGFQRRKEYTDYPHQFLEYIHMRRKVLLGIFSKYPIIKAELIPFPNSVNNGSYADILYKEDTIRVYNIHMQSLGITPGSGVLRRSSGDRLFRKVTGRFKQQQGQAKMIADHMASSPYPTLLCGDFNNTQFSNIYYQIKGEMQDSFIEEGIGYGRTFNFFRIPLRIDFIMADETFEVRAHKNYDLKYSDHYPIMASFRLKQ